MKLSGTVPALARGVAILRGLEDGKARRLGELAAATRLPKASLLRLLRTLEQLGLVSRDPQTRAFAARARLVPLAAPAPDFDRLVGETLRDLTRATGHTSEWYVPSPRGLVLVARHEPPDREVAIRARIGFLRAPTPELEAVATIGHAWFPGGAPPAAGLWTHVRDGVRRTLTRAQAESRIRQARHSGTAVDRFCNANGVRRAAAVVRRGGAPVGVLAVAEYVVAPRRAPDPATLERLSEGARRLSEPPALNPQGETR